ncbi:MAG TPA: hypothetical protein VFV01_21650 [Spirillospora sp.]|nr:hypothetical protein [Spirillospora sp.]
MSFSDEIAFKVRALGNLVESLQAETRRVAANAQNNSNPSILTEIEGGLGVVEVDRWARLNAIRLDAKQIRRCSAETFSRELVAAINRAEQAARDSLVRTSNATSAITSSDPE